MFESFNFAYFWKLKIYNPIILMERDKRIFDLIEQEHQRQLHGVAFTATRTVITYRVLLTGSYTAILLY